MKRLKTKLHQKALREYKKLILSGYTNTLWLLDQFDDEWGELAKCMINLKTKIEREIGNPEYGHPEYQAGRLFAIEDICSCCKIKEILARQENERVSRGKLPDFMSACKNIAISAYKKGRDTTPDPNQTP